MTVFSREDNVGWFYGFILFSEVIFIELIERRRRASSVPDSMKEIKKKLRLIDKSILSETIDLDNVYSQNFKVPVTSATSYIRVIRDGKIQLICVNLLVPGDFVVLLGGEKVSNLPLIFQPVNLLLPSFQKTNLGLPSHSSVILIENFPVTQIFEDQLKSPRRNRFIFSMLQQKFQFILSFGLLINFQNNFDFKSILIPLILLSSPLLRFFWWLNSTCYISLLLDQLIRSETPFSESSPSEDVDEFDEDAPPPVKNIKIPSWKVISEVLHQLLFGGRKRTGGILRLWDGDVIEPLALTSVLCFTDREGSISNAHSRPCELIIPTMNESELTAVELIPTMSDPQIVRPILSNNPLIQSFDLRTIGLAMLLSTECGHGPDSSKPHCTHGNILKELCHNLPEHLQTCYCNLSREIGFDLSVLNRFKQIKTFRTHQTHQITTGHGLKHKKTSSVSILVEDQADKTNNESEIPSGHLFTFGEVSDILNFSSFALAKDFAGNSKVTKLSESLKLKLYDFEGTMRSCDVNCVAFSYRPIFIDENITEIPTTKHVFLGLISVCPEPKEHFQEFIDDLEAAGVRFAYFSPFREQASKAFGERLGLETDWNSCILLSEHPNPSSQSSGYSALSDIKARLPRGVQAIRPHLESVDDIPLHVSIFAECNSQNSAEMIKIYQEAGEIVSIIGSCRSVRNSKCFQQSHFAIGVDSFKPGNIENFDTISLDINSNSVKLILPSDSSPYIITELIRESRTILQNSINGWEFLSGTLSCLILIGGISHFTLPVTISIFCMTISLSSGPYDPFVMKTHSTVLDSSKCPESLAISFLFSCSLMTIVRFLPTLISIFILKFIFTSTPGICIVLLLQAFSFTHSHEGLNSNLCVSFLLCTIPLIISSILYNGGVLGILCVMWHEMIKSVYLKDHYEQAQKRAKLLFNTKLGMHSPV